MAPRSNDYFAKREAKECVAALKAKVENWNDTLSSTGYMSKLRDMYSAYHGAYFNSVGDAHQISFGGDDEELIELPVNHFRNIASHMITMTTSSRPAMECRAANTDYKTLMQTQLGNGLLDYYMREKKLEEYFKESCEYGVVLGSGWIKLSWNAMLGGITNQKEIDDAIAKNETIERMGGETIEVPSKQYEGDVEFSTLSPLDIISDLSKEGRQHEWVICRTFKNRYDLIAKYPEYEKEILAIDSKENFDRIRFSSGIDDSTDDIPVYEFFHRRTEAVPNGRYIFFASKDSVFYDGDLPYKNIPLYGLFPGKIIGTPLGYTPMFDILPIQDALNSLYSTILTNQSAFGVQNILNPTGSNIDVNQIYGGLNVINYNPQAGKPESFNLTDTPKEIFEFIGMLVQAAETVSGINSVVRGNPEASLRSGSAIAMIQSNAIQYMTNLQASYTFLIENVGLGLLEILQDFADSPRIAEIVGESGKAYMQEFKGEDLRDINRVIVDSANPLTKTISGRVQMADNLLQYQLLRDPEQYINVINTGKLEVATEDISTELALIKNENEGLLRGEDQIAIMTDNHLKHINSHKSVLNDPVLRREPELVKKVLAHIQEHLELLKTSDPNTLMALGQQPIAQAPMPNPQPGDQTMPPADMEALQNLPPQEQAVQQIGASVQQATLPQGFEGIPLTPEQNMEQKGMKG